MWAHPSKQCTLGAQSRHWYWLDLETTGILKIFFLYKSYRSFRSYTVKSCMVLYSKNQGCEKIGQIVAFSDGLSSQNLPEYSRPGQNLAPQYLRRYQYNCLKIGIFTISTSWASMPNHLKLWAPNVGSYDWCEKTFSLLYNWQAFDSLRKFLLSCMMILSSHGSS